MFHGVDKVGKTQTNKKTPTTTKETKCSINRGAHIQSNPVLKGLIQTGFSTLQVDKAFNLGSHFPARSRPLRTGYVHGYGSISSREK